MINKDYNNLFISPARSIKGKVELFNGSTLANTFNYNDALTSIAIERNAENKFFGFGICQKAEMKLRDKDRLINIINDDLLKVYFNIEEQEFINNFPDFYVTDVKRDENTNELTVTAYDKINEASAHTLAELNLTSYSIREVGAASASLLGLEFEIINVNDTSFDTYYEDGANFNGNETIRDVWNDIAEVTQTIYYISGNKLIFKQLDKSGEAVYSITKASYFELTSKGNCRLSGITSATELGDNLTYNLEGEEGLIQTITDNAFWDLHEDRAVLLENAVNTIGGLSADQFTCKWRGNYLLEPGDKITITAKDNSTITTFLLADKITYNGGFSAECAWSFVEDGVMHSNPTSLGEKLKQTFAKVDKANQEITIAVQQIQGQEERISKIEMNTSGISATVQELSKQVSAAMTSEEVQIAIQEELENGVEKVTTTTGFTFDEKGLTVSKSNSEMTTTITEDGMTVSKNNSVMLSANNTGVDAVNLRANTYLIIGLNSRLENYNDGNRTGCFWIR